MPKSRLEIGTGFYQSESLPFANQRCVNLYPNIPQGNALAQSSLFNCEGLREVNNTSRLRKDANRGSIEFKNLAYFVNGSKFWQVEKITPVVGEPEYRTTLIGDVGGGRGRVSLAENGEQIIIINDVGQGFIYQPSVSDSLFPITDAGLYANGTPKKVVYIDRYFVVSTDEKKAIISAVGDGTNWNAIDFISAEADPDDVVAPFIHRNQLYLLGSITTEQFQNIGGAGVPFRRVNGFVVPVGCSSASSVVNVGDNVYWVGNGENQKAGIWAFSGGQPEKISTTAIENKLAELSLDEITDIFSFAYSQRGNTFIHFTTKYNTFVFNPVNGLWHERESEITSQNGERTTNPCRIASVINVFNDLLVGDNFGGTIGVIDNSVINEYEEYLISFFTTSPVQSSNAFTMPEIELLCETGLGNQDIPNPKIRMHISRDGVLFENPRTREVGKSGERLRRVIWYKNGRVNARCVLKFVCSDPVPRRWYGVDLKLKGSI